jgi:hypothetical protein
MARLMRLCAERLDDSDAVGAAVLGWRGDPGVAADNAPLRLAGVLHRLVLSGAAPELAQCYPPNAVDEEMLWNAVARALETHAAPLIAGLAHAPQTNEVRRAGAILPCLSMIARATGQPLALW